MTDSPTVNQTIVAAACFIGGGAVRELIAWEMRRRETTGTQSMRLVAQELIQAGHRQIELKLDGMAEAIRKISETLVRFEAIQERLARHESTLDAHQQWIDDARVPIHYVRTEMFKREAGQ